jgi:capsular exopolysaccharide synthesis family protein
VSVTTNLRVATAASVAEPSEKLIPQAFATEQYRTLAHTVEQLAKVGKSVIAITSPISGDGKTVTSLNLARALAQAPGTRVLLIDADLRRGSVAEQFGLGRNAGPGLSGAIADPTCVLETVIRQRPGSNLWVLPAGACPATPYEALRSLRFGELVHEARTHFTHVIIDTPPVVPVADWRALTEWVDGFVLVVNAHKTPRALLDEALSGMEPSSVIGLIFNGCDLPFSGRYRGYYSYGEAPPQPGLWARLFGRKAALMSPANRKSERAAR